jgi:bacillolysin
MVHGNGDGMEWGPLSLDSDTVAHELMHSVTNWTSGLIYADESGKFRITKNA